MKTERTKIFEDLGKKTDLDRTIESVVKAAGDLIKLWESFQPFQKIRNIEQFENLCTDPVAAMNQVLIEQVNKNMVGNAKLNPRALAGLLDIDYENWLHVVRGEVVTEGCKPCAASAVTRKNGKGVISFSTYSQYKHLLLFDGIFRINEDAVAEEKKQYDIFIDDPESVKEFNFWHNACTALNELAKRNCLGDLNELSRGLRGVITFSYATNKLSVDQQALYYEISRLNK